MRLTFVTKDDRSPGGGSPTIFRTDRPGRPTLVSQGWKLDPETAAGLGMPDAEDAVEITLDMVVEAVRILTDNDR